LGEWGASAPTTTDTMLGMPVANHRIAQHRPANQRGGDTRCNGGSASDHQHQHVGGRKDADGYSKHSPAKQDDVHSLFQERSMPKPNLSAMSVDALLKLLADVEQVLTRRAEEMIFPNSPAPK